MTSVVYPGSFDPITWGHIDVIKRLSPHYEEIVVLVTNNSKKNYFFSSETRVQLIESSLKGMTNVKVDQFDGLTMDYAQQIGASLIIRGLRNTIDFEYERAMAHTNKKLCPHIETMVVFSNPRFDYLSSQMVKEVAHFNRPLDDLVPSEVKQALAKRKNDL